MPCLCRAHFLPNGPNLHCKPGSVSSDYILAERCFLWVWTAAILKAVLPDLQTPFYMFAPLIQAILFSLATKDRSPCTMYTPTLCKLLPQQAWSLKLAIVRQFPGCCTHSSIQCDATHGAESAALRQSLSGRSAEELQHLGELTLQFI